jgi:hypothetical protein
MIDALIGKRRRAVCVKDFYYRNREPRIQSHQCLPSWPIRRALLYATILERFEQRERRGRLATTALVLFVVIL